MVKLFALFSLCFLLSSAVTGNELNFNWKIVLKDLYNLTTDLLTLLSQLIPQPEDTGKNITEILDGHGYPWEQHEVITEDKYKLQIFHIPHGTNKSDENTNKPVVFLMHGLLSSAVDFVNMGPNDSLGLILADQGFDVWLGNSRGNMFGRKHVTMNPDKDNDFWNFSWHEQGIYDLPASIDYILTKTGARNLTYIGHSQGTTNLFVMSSTRPEYNEKITMAVVLAPIAFMQNMTSPIPRILADNLDLVEFVMTTVLGVHEIPSTDLLSLMGKVLCNENVGTHFLCNVFLEVVVGFDTQQINTALLPVFLSNTPAGCSLNQPIHYLQLVNSGFFRQYDYGLIENLLKYGSIIPPNYNLSAISIPLALLHADDDYMAAEYNVKQLVQNLPNVVVNELIKDFNHLDFIWAKDAREKVYDKTLNIIKSYS